ncbi:MAG: hypothetical protein GY940_32225, partial [bacterium]|nr:hypothetical protein [bacterium]
LKTNQSNPETLATAATVYFAAGQPVKAKQYITKALALNQNCKPALLTQIMLHLYHREFNQAKETYEKLSSLDRQWATSNFLFNIGTDVYRASGDTQRLIQLYKTHAATNQTDKYYQDSLKNDYKMYKKVGKKKLFNVETDSDKVTIPFVTGQNNLRENTVFMPVKGMRFKVLLDTGNASGWLLHGRKLRDLLKPKKGGRMLTRIGSEAGLLDGYRQLCKKLDFKNFRIHNADGIYIPKPRANFPDANLNPLFISNRVITIDFIKKELILRTKDRFEKDLQSLNSTRTVSRLPWNGHKHAFAPVSVKGKNGLVMIETGAEDIAYDLDFVTGIQLPLQPRRKFLANGKVFNYHLTAATLSIGGLQLQRNNAEVWPFQRFHHPVTGLKPDVIIGPKTWKGKFAVSFDPFSRQIVLVNIQ